VTPGVDRSTLRILTVCTANVCRSPVAERLLARHLSARGYEATITSAGTHGGRLGAHADTLRAGSEADLDLRDHTSRLLDASIIAGDGSDLIVTMTREHLRTVVGLDPSAWPRVFTLKELARRALTVPLDQPVGAAGFGRWVATLTDGRRASEMMTPSTDDDLGDPYGGSYSEHRAMVVEVDELCRRIALLMPSPTV